LRVLRSGDIGLAEGYIAQDWSTPHLADLLRLLMANRDALESLVYGAWWGRLAYRLRHLLNRNTRAGSRATSTPTTTWATLSTSCGWTRA
jgi:cyclopropane-fatty-acyl-phospholipid synthase